jgi:hypothetical protein
MSESGLYPRGPSDAEIRASRKKVDDELNAIWERDQQKREAKEDAERELRVKADAAEREAERQRKEAEALAAIEALISDPADWAKQFLALKAEVADLKAANRGPSHKASVGASIDDGQLANGVASGAREPIVVEPNMERHRADQKAQLRRLGYGR